MCWKSLYPAKGYLLLYVNTWQVLETTLFHNIWSMSAPDVLEIALSHKGHFVYMNTWCVLDRALSCKGYFCLCEQLTGVGNSFILQYLVNLNTQHVLATALSFNNHSVSTPDMCWQQLYFSIITLCQHLICVGNSFILQYLVNLNTQHVLETALSHNIRSMSTPDLCWQQFYPAIFGLREQLTCV